MLNFFKILFTLLLFVPKVYASCAIFSCNATLDSSLTDLKENSVYGHIYDNVQLLNCCNNDPELSIIVSSKTDFVGGKASSLTPITLSPGEKIELGNVPGFKNYRNNAAIQSIVLKATYMDPVCPSRGSCSRELCLTIPTYYGNSPLKCKKIMGLKRSDAREAMPKIETCDIVASSCDDTKVSQSMFSFTGPAIQCLTDTLRQNFFEPQPGCIVRKDSEANVNMSFLANFAVFQEALKVSVRALLILYTMGFGIKMLLNQSEFSLEVAVKFVLKMILVGYFAVGWGPAYFKDGIKTTSNGTIEWALPILTQVTSDFASMAFGAASGENGLCEFDNNNYPKGYGYYGLWDRLDCKLGALFLVKKIYGFGFLTRDKFDYGWRKIRTPYAPNSDPRPEKDGDIKAIAEDTAQVGLWFIIFRFFMGGEFLIVIALIFFMVIILSLILGFVNLYTVCLVTLHVLIYLSPIFVPMALFERTKSYFESWLKVTVSCALQPMVIACFIAMMLSMYEEVLFGNCDFLRHDYTNGSEYKATFELRVPKADPGKCVITTGYRLVSYVLGHGGESFGALLFTVETIKDEFNIWLNCIILIVFSYIMRFFIDALYTIASDITGGMNVGQIAFKMRTLAATMQKGVNWAAGKAAGAAKGGGGKAKRDNAGSGADSKGSDGGGE